jgi:hypothetical protein
MFNVSLYLNPGNCSSVRLVASQEQNGRRTIWGGSISAPEPIVAMSLMRHGDHVDSARSRKVTSEQLPISLLVSEAASGEPSSLYVTWSIGQGQTQLGLDEVATVELAGSLERDVVVGEPFHFADVGRQVSLFGLVLLRAQVKGRRNHLWGLKDKYLERLPPTWREIMAHGRAGTCRISDGA